MSYFNPPSVIEAVKGIWPWFWGINKLLWPVWVLIGAMAVVNVLKFWFEKKIDLWKFTKIKKKCSDCAEWIPREAIKCGYCGKKYESNSK